MHSFPILFNNGTAYLILFLMVYFTFIGFPVVCFSPSITLRLILFFSACHPVVLQHTLHFIHGFCLSLRFLIRHALGCAEVGISFSALPTPRPELTEPRQSLDSLGSFFFQLREICLLHDYCVFDFFFHLHISSLAWLLQFCSFALYCLYLCVRLF